MYIELHCHSPYSFLDGASTIEELVRQAALFGMPALAITDHNTLTAAVKFHEVCEQYGIKPIYGTEVTMSDGSHLTLLAKSRTGYGNICRLLSTSYAIGGRLMPALPWDQLPLHAAGVICLTGCRQGKISSLIRDHRHLEALIVAQQLKDIFGDDLFIELQDDLTPHAARVCHELVLLARRIGARCVATNNVHYATSDGMIAHDVKRCIAMGITTAEHHIARPFNTERRLKSAKEMCDLFSWCPEAVANTMLIAEQCSGDGIMPLGEEFTPDYPTANGESAVEHLRTLAYEGARRRRGNFTRQGKERLDYELKLLAELGYTDFVLHAARIVRWARGEGIMVTGRGSGADSEVCYCLGLTDIDVLERNLPVARWVAPGKNPDIDIDFEARRRDDVFRWVSKTYGEENVALCCTYTTYWAKGALRDIGRALALPPQALAWFTKHMSGFSDAGKIAEAFARNAELRAYSSLTQRFEQLFDLCGKIAGHPRHLGSHSSGLVLSGLPLSTLNVVTPSARGVLPIVMLDKDDVETMGSVKLDILSLPILSVVKDSEHDIQRSDADFSYDNIPREDQATYRMLWSGNNCGAFQLGSPAQAALATQLHPRDFEDLVRSCALIRPGPIKARAVKKYIAARNGYSRIEYLHPSLKPILGRTYGVCCFQEQVSYIISAMLNINDAQADTWRKQLAKHARFGTMGQARASFVKRSCQVHRDLSVENSNKIMDELEGWASLGFVEGHSASFALTAQKTAYMICHNPIQYYAALMSNQPCGFYDPQSIAAEARRRGGQILPLDINVSELACTTDDEATSIRIGYCLVSGIRNEDVEAILAERANGEYRSLLDFCVRLPLRRDLLESLILCGAFDALHDFNRRGLIWRLNETLAKAQAIRADTVSSSQKRLDIHLIGANATPIAWEIEDFSDWDKLLWEWRIVSVTTSCHPFAHLRQSLAARGIITAHEAMQLKTGFRATVAGLNIRPHRPPSKSGGRHLFCTIEDESAYMQSAFYGTNIDDNMATILLSPAVIVRGRMIRKGYGCSMEVERAWPLSIRDFRPAESVESRQELVEVARSGARSYR
ncbi:DNA-directed DNA polymerase [Capsulimonas corticalis]|uniref:DNA-directed DNA polymerase n=1 Tax=Capsulimonas corticalis TaxID=2219043 RepID=A0A402CW13_9BACT|nr:DNA polymerase III subunit alpha [Capsulimonas corticalis]BDI33983.1 DNA-directed DNA polymerase [Capsulimonas corticalis]